MPKISGNELLRLNHNDVLLNYSYNIIHQTVNQSMTYLKKHQKYISSWGANHPEALHVIWSDNDNYTLVKTHYPDYLQTYNELPLKINRIDMIRYMYMHRFGGMYADADFEAHTNIFDIIKNDAEDVYIVKSNYLINEYVQNSLLISKTINNEFWISALNMMAQINNFIRTGALDCDQRTSKPFYFYNIFLREAMKNLYVTRISGPSLIDKVIVSNIGNPDVKIKILGCEYINSIATHHQNASWFTGKQLICMVAPTLLAIIFIFLICILGIYLASKKKQHQQRYLLNPII